MKPKFHFMWLVLVFIAHSGLAGITGSISGRLIDKATRQGLPGAEVVIIDTKLWTVADKYGYYSITNIPPGVYDIRAKMLGYTTMVMRNVVVRADQFQEIHFEMVSEAIEGPEIEVVAEAPLISKNSPSISQSLGFAELNQKLPVDHFFHALKTQISAIDGHIRGGRKYHTVYLLDGQSIQDPLFREISTVVPLSAVSDISIYSGGFNATYGEALSGLVNLSTREGKEKTEGFLKIFTDNFGAKIKNDNLRRIEMSLGGPLLLSFGGPMYDFNYYISGCTNFDQLRPSNGFQYDRITLPADQNYHYTYKLSFRLWQKIKINIQHISSNWQSSYVDSYFSEKEAIEHSIENHKDGRRINFTLIHTLNPKSFYTISFGRDIYQKQFDNQMIIHSDEDRSQNQTDGKFSNWTHAIHERVYFLKAAYYHQIAASDLIQFGADLNLYHIYMTNLAFDRFSLAHWRQSELMSSPSDRLSVDPFMLALFAQNRMEYGNIVINLGLRSDYFDPRVVFPEQSVVSHADTLLLAAQHARPQFQLSPRFEVSLPFLLKDDRVYFNYGWFFQTPPLYYYYFNSKQGLDRNYPLLGNPQLGAEKTEALEISYQKAVATKSIIGAAGFLKKVKNLVNSANYYTGSEHPAGYTQFKNLDHATVKGCEVFFEKRPGNSNFSGKASYTYSRASGTGSFPLQNYYSLRQGSSYPSAFRPLPLAWDQRHKITIHLSYLTPQKIDINLLAQFNSPLPKINDKFEITGRGQWRNYIDCRISRSFRLLKGHLTPYAEILNLLDNREPNRVTNPYYLSDDNSWMLGLDSYLYEYGRRIRVGCLISFQ